MLQFQLPDRGRCDNFWNQFISYIVRFNVKWSNLRCTWSLRHWQWGYCCSYLRWYGDNRWESMPKTGHTRFPCSPERLLSIKKCSNVFFGIRASGVFVYTWSRHEDVCPRCTRVTVEIICCQPEDKRCSWTYSRKGCKEPWCAVGVPNQHQFISPRTNWLPLCWSQWCCWSPSSCLLLY